MENRVQCPSCKGKGHIFDSYSLFFPVYWIMALFEAKNANGDTRKTCGQCNGTGFIEPRVK